MKKFTPILVALVIMILSSILIPVLQTNFYRDNYQSRYTTSFVAGNSATSLSLSEDYKDYMIDYLDDNFLIKTPNSGIGDGARDSYQILESFRYIFCLLNSGNISEIELANQIIQKNLLIDAMPLGKPHTVSWLSSLESWGGFPWWWKENVWMEQIIYSNIDSYATFHIIPYLVLISNQFGYLLTASSSDAIQGAILPLITWSNNQNIYPEESVKFLSKVHSLLMLNSILKSPFIERQAIQLFLQFSEYIIERGRSNIPSSSELANVINSLKLIIHYIPTDLIPIVEATAKTLLTFDNTPPLVQVEVNVSQRFFNPNFDAELLFSSSLLDNYLELSNYDSDITKDALSEYQMIGFGIHWVFYWLIGLIVVLSFILSKKEGQSDPEQTDRHVRVMKINQFFEIPGLVLTSIIAIYVMVAGHDYPSMYAFLFVWPLIFTYGFRKNQDGMVYGVLLFAIIESLVVYSFFSYSYFNPILLFLVIWITDIGHSLYLSTKFIRGDAVGEGANSPNLGKCLIFCIIFGIFFVISFSSRLPSWQGLPYLLALFLIIKPAVLLRAKFG